MSFKDQNWEQRERTLGDIAEREFEKWAGSKHIKYDRFGICRPNVDARLLADTISHMPDYLAQLGPHVYLIEVQGCGADRTVKFKHRKLRAAGRWQRLHTVLWYFYNQAAGESVLMRHAAVERMCAFGMGFRTDGYFDGTKPIAQVSWSTLKRAAAQDHSEEIDGI